jgi:hypothetical protein
MKFRAIPQIIHDYADDLIDANGEVDWDKLRDLLENGQTDDES